MNDWRRVIQRWIRRAFYKEAAETSPLQAPETIKIPANLQEAASRLTDWHQTKHPNHIKRRDRVEYSGAHPLIVDFYRALQKELESRGFPFYAHGLFREWDLQAELFRQGVTKARPGQSPHNYGCAVDIVHSGRFWDLTKEEWALIGAIGKEVARKRNVQVHWGGDWSFYDPAHWELAHWRDVHQYAHDRLLDLDERMSWGDFLIMENELKPSDTEGRLGPRARLIAENRKIKTLLAD